MAQEKTAERGADEDLAQHVAQLREDVARLSEALLDRGKDKAASLRERGEQSLDALVKQAGAAEHHVEDAVRNNPIQSLAIAAGLGLLIGYMTRR